MIGVVVPVHNEEQLLPRCLASLQKAARDPLLCHEPVLILAVLDACVDRSEALAREGGALVLKTSARCVGKARALGVEYALGQGARWLACTDADSEVPADWLSRQLSHQADAICGTVQVDDWDNHDATLRQRFEAHYTSADGHQHIHGANLGVSAAAYRSAGGFSPLRTGEDVALINALRARGLQIKWVADPCVKTSARIDARAPEGFGAFLVTLKTKIGAKSHPLAGCPSFLG